MLPFWYVPDICLIPGGDVQSFWSKMSTNVRDTSWSFAYICNSPLLSPVSKQTTPPPQEQQTPPKHHHHSHYNKNTTTITKNLETLRHWEPDTDRRGHLMWKKFAAVGWMGSVAQCTSLVTGETRLVPAKAAAGLQKGSQPFLLWIHSMRKCESEKGKIVEINGCERAGNASNILHHCCGSINFSRKM